MVMLEWLAANREWLNGSRLRRIGARFAAQPGLDRHPLFDRTSLSALEHFLSGDRKRDIPGRAGNSRATERTGSPYWLEVIRSFRARGIVAPLSLGEPALLQLRLRGLLGRDARSDLLCYLLANRSGNSLAVSRTIHCDQKSAWRILDKWSAAGFVTKQRDGYLLTRTKEWLSFLELETVPAYVDWTRLFIALDRLNAVLAEATDDDRYLVASSFRDIEPDVSEFSRLADVVFPDGRRFPGAQLFEPFAAALLELIRRI
jgi:hypothetical protein